MSRKASTSQLCQNLEALLWHKVGAQLSVCTEPVYVQMAGCTNVVCAPSKQGFQSPPGLPKLYCLSALLLLSKQKKCKYRRALPADRSRTVACSLLECGSLEAPMLAGVSPGAGDQGDGLGPGQYQPALHPQDTIDSAEVPAEAAGSDPALHADQEPQQPQPQPQGPAEDQAFRPAVGHTIAAEAAALAAQSQIAAARSHIEVARQPPYTNPDTEDLLKAIQQQAARDGCLQQVAQAATTGRPKLPRPTEPVDCPRCGSGDTKFCYYNNYNAKQPRFYCKVRATGFAAAGCLDLESFKSVCFAVQSNPLHAIGRATSENSQLCRAAKGTGHQGARSATCQWGQARDGTSL